MHVYFDEAGDLGFSFKHEFMQGGSSRYLTLGFLLVNSNLRHIVKKLTIDFRKKHGFPRRRELKGKLLNPANLQAFVVAANSLLSSGDDFRFRSITVRKEHVQEHIRGTPTSSITT